MSYDEASRTFKLKGWENRPADSQDQCPGAGDVEITFAPDANSGDSSLLVSAAGWPILDGYVGLGEAGIPKLLIDGQNPKDGKYPFKLEFEKRPAKVGDPVVALFEGGSDEAVYSFYFSGVVGAKASPSGACE